ncbi:MAG: peptidase and in kexin sedolisin [Xanthomonadaceae bacterium]|nr:peptidase and in kexin sedolisin [Xanthomonadaceae bacterium]
MNKLAKAISVAIVFCGAATSAHAATYIVTAKSLAFDTALARKIEAAGGTVTARLPQIGVAVVESSDSTFSARAAKVQGIRSAVYDYTFQSDPSEATSVVDADFTNPPNSGDDDARFDLEWGSQAIDVAGAWNAGYRGAGATVAVLDAGVSCQHPDIAANLLLSESTSFVPGEGVCHPLVNGFNHGTHVAGIIAAPDNGIGTIGVAPEAKILAVKVLSDAGSGSFAGIIQGIVYAGDHGADVINMSLGVHGGLPVNGKGANDVSELVNATKRAVAYARARNALTVVSAGNDAMDLDHASGVKICDTDGVCYVANLRSFPAELPGALSISATAPIGWAKAPTATFLDNLASYSNYGASAIAFAGPGGDSAYPGNENCTMAGITRPCWVFDLVFAPGGYSISNGQVLASYSWAAGTSMAAPHVSGVAALIIGKHGGTLAPSEVERILRASSDDLGKPGNDAAYGGGRVDAARAVQY